MRLATTLLLALAASAAAQDNPALPIIKSAIEAHGVFPGNDLPGVWLGRGAARLAAVHGVRPGETALVVANTAEGPSIADALRGAGADVTLVAGRVLEARGHGRVSSATVLTPEGRRAFACDALVLSLGWQPRDTLLRMTADAEVSALTAWRMGSVTLRVIRKPIKASNANAPPVPRTIASIVHAAERSASAVRVASSAFSSPSTWPRRWAERASPSTACTHHRSCRPRW